MVYNRFALSVVVLSILLGLAGLAFVYVLLNDYLVITKISLGVIWMALLGVLIFYVQRTNRELSRFLDNLKFLDTIKSSKEKDLSYKKLNLSFNRIIEIVKAIKSEHEAEAHFFRSTVENIPVGVIVFEGDGKVYMINTAAKNILKLTHANYYKDIDLQGELLGETLFQLNPGENKLIKTPLNDGLLYLSVRSVQMKVKEKRLKIVSIQNIESELESEELQAWQKLIRVMTHEIMNSVSPVKSLTFGMIKMLENKFQSEHLSVVEIDTADKLLEGLKAIEKRSQGLLSFVKNYQNLTSLPYPNFEEVSVNQMFSEIDQLMQKELNHHTVSLELAFTEENMMIQADQKLIIQILINLIKNAQYALKDRTDGKIKLSAQKTKDKNVLIRVSDNGVGIPVDIRDKIFIPFFTTRKGGSGIGLSFARQVMQMHKGRLYVQSEEGLYTTFTLVF